MQFGYDPGMCMNLPSLRATRDLALALHGEAYFPHLERVAGYLDELLSLIPEGHFDERERGAALAAAYLHDAVEDGFATVAALRELGYDETALAIVEGMTRDPAAGTYHEKMVETAESGNLLLICCKLADNRDNSMPWRIEQLPEEKKSIVRRYRRARRTLFEGLRSLLLERGATLADVEKVEEWLGNADPHPW